MNIDKIRFLNIPDSTHPFLVIYKPSGIPSAPLRVGDESALNYALEKFPEIKTVHGKKEIEFGLIHRIDTETRGLVLIALNQSFYDFMQNEQNEGRFEKWYRAKVEGNPDAVKDLEGFSGLNEGHEALANGRQATVSSSFRKFGPKGREVRPVDSKSGKSALKKSGEKEYFTELTPGEQNFIHAHIVSGFRHQVRCHLAWCGFPIVGDRIYNPAYRNVPECKMEFEAYKISFRNPVTGAVEVYQTDR